MTHDLVRRLEAATGPDRELDECLFELVHGRKRNISTFEQRDPSEKLPAYTASIDAALTLMPEGYYGRVSPRFYSEYDKFEKRIVLWDAYCIRPRWEEASPMNEDYFTVFGNSEPHTSPAIALCIASLRARLA